MKVANAQLARGKDVSKPVMKASAAQNSAPAPPAELFHQVLPLAILPCFYMCLRCLCAFLQLNRSYQQCFYAVLLSRATRIMTPECQLLLSHPDCLTLPI